jgi:(+)-pinoresinol hydroxylase
MRSLIALLAALPLVAAAQEPPGKALFNRWCADCHAPGVGHTGTQQLERIRGAKLAVLEQRRDLNVGLIRHVVRNGQVAMAPYRPSEISDAELTELANYLAPAGKRRR